MGFKKLKTLILKNTPRKLVNIYQEPIKKENEKLDPFSTLSYSQEGEDLILKRIFEGQKTGFYVDVGAHHPKRFSNTYLFYKIGWRGINIDAMPGSMAIFKEIRPNDINLEIGVSKEQEEKIYYMFNQQAINTFSEIEAKKKLNIEKFKVVETRKINTLPLRMILKQYLPKHTKIDFITIDVEGLDFEVIQSNDWENYRPKIVLVEDLNNFHLTKLNHNRVFKELNKNGYELVAKTYNTLFFKNIRQD
ncbi:FkbM family methyltransferase [Salegentibacter sp. LM13S]|uniref:FkbM family methyltransferase n=1 Tax=Salegentibacter lacus TaxID=2873599 RepID=UPI001CCC48D5|nr:FkbM family methyltransferase [Salegentibacter lacus]MBZ9632349.1 FkbM family methyltransferase [Salegentibacter lacus]